MTEAVRYRIRHTTRYEYADEVTIAQNEARLCPRDGQNQAAHSTRFVVEPAPTFMERQRDYFGNSVDLFSFEEPHDCFELTAHSEVTVSRRQLPEPASSLPWEQARIGHLDGTSSEGFEALQYGFESPHVGWDAAIEGYARQTFQDGRPLLESAIELTERIHRDFAYVPGVTTIATPTTTVFKNRRGVCQDFAHLQLAMLRALGLSARYVSGYLLTRPPPGEKKLVGADASHAWIAVYCPGYGYVDLDPTNAAVVGLDHTTLAWGRDFADVSPLKGVVLGGGAHNVSVAVDVNPV